MDNGRKLSEEMGAEVRKLEVKQAQTKNKMGLGEGEIK